MNNNIDKMCFADLTKNKAIRIPQIQRDYAQGRQHKEVKEIRNHFVRTLMLVITGKSAESQLDFIYGSDRNGAFEPLDGQQRLTTLFLLHWVLGVNLLTEDGESILTYETRNTSEAFCKELVCHNAKQFVDEASAKTIESKQNAKKEKSKPEEERNPSKMEIHEYQPSEIIMNRDWFQWGWRFDPTINSMLVMIDTICSQMDWTLDLNECQKRLNNITFNHLDLGVIGMSDELFVKMNARGKLLSDFDKLKSTLEEEIQLQQNEMNENGELLADTSIEHDWREHVDGKWIDLFWQKYASSVMTKTLDDKNKKERLIAAKETERRFKIFLLRMIAMQLFAKIPIAKSAATKDKPDEQDEFKMHLYEQSLSHIENLYESSYKMNENSIDNLLIAYQNQLVTWRSSDNRIKPTSCTVIDFKELLDNMNLWIVDKGNGKYTDITTLLPKESYYDADDCTYFSRLVADDISNDVIAILYSIQWFLKYYPRQENSQAWLTNFDEWVRMSRNVFKLDNNTDRINKLVDAADTFEGVYNICNDMYQYFKELNIDVYSNDSAILLFLKNRVKRYKGIDNKSIEEEIEKAKLRLIDDQGGTDIYWTTAIREAEKNPYLWGQIRCLIKWANGDLIWFKKYSDCLTKWINLDKQWKKQELYYNAMLCLQPECWKSKNRLYEFNKDRDNSMKRYLREDPDYGKSIQAFIKTWIDWNEDASFEEFCQHVINTTSNNGWVKYFKQRPNMIWEAWRKRIFEENGHIIFAQQKTTDSHCYDPMLIYIKSLAEDVFCLEEKGIWKEGVTVDLYDSKSLGSHKLVITIPNNVCEIRWGDKNGEYILTNNTDSYIIHDVDTLVSTAKSVIDDYKIQYKNK